MNKSLVLALVGILLLSTLTLFTPKSSAQASNETTLFSDNFESYVVGTFPSSGGWQLVYNGAGNQYQVVTSDYSASGSKSLQLMGSYGWSAVVKKDFSSTSSLIGFEVSMMVPQTEDGGCVAFYNANIEAWGRYYGIIGFGGDGYIWASIQDNPRLNVRLQPYNPGTWYRVRVVVDKSAWTYDVWINDVLVGQDLTTYYNPNEIQSLQFQVGWINDRAYFDDAQVFEESQSPTPTPSTPAPTPTPKPIPTPYSVTINAYGSTEEAGLAIAISEDGTLTPHSTPYTFQGLTGTHSFTVAQKDSDNFAFANWDNNPNDFSTTISVSSGGQHTAYYRALDYVPANFQAKAEISATGEDIINLTWSGPTQSSGVTVLWYYLFRSTTRDFAVPWGASYEILSSTTTEYQDSLLSGDNSIYYYRIAALLPQGMGSASASMGCSRLETFKGIYNEVTGVNSLQVQGGEGFSIQQNFYIYSGLTDSKNKPVIYWCQNVIETNAYDYTLRTFTGIPFSRMYVFRYDWTLGRPDLSTEVCHVDLPEMPNSVPNTIDFLSKIVGDSLVMENSMGGEWVFSRLGLSFYNLYLTDGAYILPGTENLFGNTPKDLPPSLVMVGYCGGGDVVFRSGDGSVQYKTMLDQTWINARTTFANPSEYPGGTGESSIGLQWPPTKGNYAIFKSPQDTSPSFEGFFFTPEFDNPTSQGAGASVLTVVSTSDGRTIIDNDATTGINLCVSSASLVDGTLLAVQTVNYGSSQPVGTGPALVSEGRFYDVEVTPIVGVSLGSDVSVEVSISDPTFTSSCVICYWNAGTWTQVFTTFIAPDTVVGSIPASALTGTPIVVGTPGSFVMPEYATGGLLALIGCFAAFIVYIEFKKGFGVLNINKRLKQG